MSLGKLAAVVAIAGGITAVGSTAGAQAAATAVASYGVFSGGYNLYGQSYSPARYYSAYGYRSSENHVSPNYRSTGNLGYYNRDRHGNSGRHYLTRYHTYSGYNGGGQGTYTYGY